MSQHERKCVVVLKINQVMAKKKTSEGGAPRVNKYSVAPLIEKYYNQYYSIETYPAEQCVAFNAVADEWGVLGNFAHTALVVDGVTFKCSEQLYQVMKFTDPDVIGKVYEGITFKGLKKGTVKMVAKSYETQGYRRKDWGSMLVDALKFCLQTKYEQSEEFRKALESSKGFYIVEDQSTRKKGADATADTWGALLRDGSYVGPNLMGRLLMELRDNGKLEYKLPEDAFDFLKHLK